MVDNKGDQPTKKQSQKSPQQQHQRQKSPSPKDPLEEPTSKEPRHKQIVVTGVAPPPPPPPPPPPLLCVPILGGATKTTTLTTSSSTPPPIFEQVELAINPKRPRYGPTSSASTQWKLLPSPSHQHRQTQLAPGDESSPSPTTHSHAQLHLQAQTTVASSSDTASSPPHSHETTKPEADQNPSLHHPHHPQFRKGKYVSPVWKPYEMLWLARAWRVQYQGGGGGGVEATTPTTHQIITGSSGELQVVQPATRGKTRAEKDREVAEFLNRHGVNRDAKTAGTKWDNMLGEFRKVYEWERGGEREQVGKSYFRLSPYERKMHRLPASFDEEVYEELAQFMGSRIRNPQLRTEGVGGSSFIGSGEDSRSLRALPLPTPPPFKDDDPISLSGRTKQLVTTSSIGGEGYFHGGVSGKGGLLGFEGTVDVNVGSGWGGSKELRRIGKIRMTWEESVNLWAEDGEHHRGRVRLQGSGFLNANELTYFDDSMVACTMEAFEDGPLKGFSVDKFVSGQHVKVFGRRNSSSSKPAPAAPASAPPSSIERIQLPLTESSTRWIPPWEYQDPTEYYVGCLRVPPTTLPSLFELSWYLQEPPPEDLRFPLRKDVYRDLPPGKELFFTTTSTELLDCRGIVFDILGSIIRSNPSISSSAASSRDSFIGLWDDCINRIVHKFCSVEVVFVRKPPSNSSSLQDTSNQGQWPNLTGFVRNFCLWRGEETDQIKEGQQQQDHPSSSLVEKLLWTYMDLPYILGYYAVGFTVTFCALSRSQDRIIRTDLYTLDLSSPLDRLKALVPSYRVAGLLPLLADRCLNNSSCYYNKQQVMITYSDFERVDMGNGNIIEMTPNTVTKFFSSKRKWAAVKEIHDLFDHRMIPHAEFICHTSEKDLLLVFKPRGINYKPANCEQLVEALKCVTKALVALHDLGFMHRDLSWDKVMMRKGDREAETEWIVCGFDEAAGAPQLYPHPSGEARGRHAPEMGRGLHGVKVDVWGIGHLVKTCGLGTNGVPKMLRELQNKCLDQNPELRPTAADCYHHLLQVQSTLQSSSSGGAHY